LRIVDTKEERMRLYRGSLSLIALCAATLIFVPLRAQQDITLDHAADAARADRGSNQDTPRFHRHPDRKIPNSYIVVLDQDAPGAAGDPGAAAADADEVILSTSSARVKHVYANALRGFSAEMTEDDALALSNDPRVRFVEEDSVMEIVTTQTNATWGLDRIDQRSLPLSGTYSYASTGSGVNAYIIDTGIRVSHTQFGGRASVAFDAVGDGRNGIDCNGHGTHVSGTVGGSTYGVAKSVRLFAVRVLSCSGSGSTSGVIAGVDWVTRHHVSPAVANMSLGGGASTSLDSAVRNSIASGVTYAVAAGNSNANASSFSPARVSEAITVGSSRINDARSSFSNFGSVVDIFAPGSSITSAWSTSDTAINTISGTSMATPHVAGVAARFLQNNRTASPATVRNAIVNAASLNRLSGIPTGTANRLLFWSGAQ
jgi:subtilisin family serine protease